MSATPRLSYVAVQIEDASDTDEVRRALDAFDAGSGLVITATVSDAVRLQLETAARARGLPVVSTTAAGAGVGSAPTIRFPDVAAARALIDLLRAVSPLKKARTAWTRTFPFTPVPVTAYRNPALCGADGGGCKIVRVLPNSRPGQPTATGELGEFVLAHHDLVPPGEDGSVLRADYLWSAAANREEVDNKRAMWFGPTTNAGRNTVPLHPDSQPFEAAWLAMRAWLGDPVPLADQIPLVCASQSTVIRLSDVGLPADYFVEHGFAAAVDTKGGGTLTLQTPTPDNKWIDLNWSSSGGTTVVEAEQPKFLMFSCDAATDTYGVRPIVEIKDGPHTHRIFSSGADNFAKNGGWWSSSRGFAAAGRLLSASIFGGHGNSLLTTEFVADPPEDARIVVRNYVPPYNPIRLDPPVSWVNGVEIKGARVVHRMASYGIVDPWWSRTTVVYMPSNGKREDTAWQDAVLDACTEQRKRAGIPTEAGASIALVLHTDEDAPAMAKTVSEKKMCNVCVIVDMDVVLEDGMPPPAGNSLVIVRDSFETFRRFVRTLAMWGHGKDKEAASALAIHLAAAKESTYKRASEFTDQKKSQPWNLNRAGGLLRVVQQAERIIAAIMEDLDPKKRDATARGFGAELNHW